MSSLATKKNVQQCKTCKAHKNKTVKQKKKKSDTQKLRAINKYKSAMQKHLNFN